MRLPTVILALVFLAAGSGFAATVRGRVVYHDELLPGTTVTLAHASGQHQEAVSNVKGEFELRNVPVGPAELTAELQGFSRIRHNVCIHEGDNSWQLAMDEPHTSCDVVWSVPYSELGISGKVSDESGHPLAGVAVLAVLADGGIAETQFTNGCGEVFLRTDYGGDHGNIVSIRIERKGYDSHTIGPPCYLHFTTELFPVCTVSAAP